MLIARVRKLATVEEIERRYAAINEFERELVESGTVVRQVHAAHLAGDAEGAAAGPAGRPEQVLEVQPRRRRRAAACGRRTGEAYEVALERTNTEHAPWFVIPSDKKWYRNLAIGRLLHDTLRGLDPQWPEADFDVEAERKRLTGEAPLG